MMANDVLALVQNTAALMEQFERRCSIIERQMHDVSTELRGLGRQLPDTVRQSADGSMDQLSEQVIHRVQDGLQAPLQNYEQRLNSATEQMAARSRQMEQQFDQLQQACRSLLWKTSMAVMLALLLVLMGGAWLSSHYHRVIRENQLSAELLKAYNKADVTLCGNGALCARVNAKAPPYGEKGEYLQVVPR